MLTTRIQITKVMAFALLVLVVVPCTTLFAQSGTRGGYLPSPARPTALPVNLEVRLPANALLWIEDTRARQTGEVRRFQSPPLPIGQKYTYRFKCIWTENGVEVVRERSVAVQAGQDVVVDLRREEPAPKKEAPPRKN